MLMTKHRKKTFDESKKSKFSSFVIKVIMTVAESFSNQLIQLIINFKYSDQAFNQLFVNYHVVILFRTII